MGLGLHHARRRHDADEQQRVADADDISVLERRVSPNAAAVDEGSVVLVLTIFRAPSSSEIVACSREVSGVLEDDAAVLAATDCGQARREREGRMRNGALRREEQPKRRYATIGGRARQRLPDGRVPPCRATAQELIRVSARPADLTREKRANVVPRS